MAFTQPPATPAAPGTAPARTNRSTFAALADAAWIWLFNTFWPWVGSFTSWYATASTELTAAQSNCSNYSIAAQQAAGTVGAVAWVSGTTYAIGDVRYSPVNFLPYRRKTAGAGVTDPSADSANWAIANSVQQCIRSARTTNTLLAAGDRGSLIDITSGTFTQTFDAAATLGPGWYCWIRNSGTGDVTLDPNLAEQIDGLTSYVMYPGESRLVTCDGTAFRSLIIQTFYRVITATMTFTVPPGYSIFEGIAWSGGQSGQRNNNATGASLGGAGGGAFPFQMSAAAMGASQVVTIGAGGAVVTTIASGNAGGNTTIGSLLTVTGGASSQGGAIAGAVGQEAGAGGAVGFGSFGVPASAKSTIWGGVSPVSPPATSGSSNYGGGCGGSLTTSAVVIAAAASSFGGNGGASASASNGTDGTAPGGGGGATQTGVQSGAGARGEVRIWGLV